jgi:hypothetical protein
MRESRSKNIVGSRKENLRFILQLSKSFGMYDPIPVSLKN